MTILPFSKCSNKDEKEQEKSQQDISPSSTPLSPSRYGNSSCSSSSSFYQPQSPEKPKREKSFSSDNWEVERRDGGRRRRRVAGPSRSTRSPPLESRERYNSDDEYDTHCAFDWKKEELYEKMLRDKKGYVINRIEEDGACLFRAVADQLYGDQEMHNVVRTKCMDYLLKNKDHFSQFIVEDFISYVNRKRQKNCFGNQLEMQAMAEMFNRPIEIYSYSIDPINTLGQHFRSDYPPIRLSYHCNCHYNSIRDPYEPSVGVGLGLPGYKPGQPDQQLLQLGMSMSETDEIEKIMMQDKLESSDMDATNEAITAAIARESYLEWVKDNSRGGIKTDSNVASSSRCEQKKHHQAEPTVTQQFGNTETSAEITEYDSVVTSDQAPCSSSHLDDNQNKGATLPHGSGQIDTLYPVYGLEEYDEDKMVEAAIALSKAEYISKLHK